MPNRDEQFDLDELKAGIKEEAEAITRGEGVVQAPRKVHSGESLWNSVSYLLDSAEEHGRELSRVPAMMYRNRFVRPGARLIARVVLYVTKFLRVRQEDFNLDVVQALRSVNSDGFSINEKITELSNQLAAVSEAVENLGPEVIEKTPGLRAAEQRHRSDMEKLEERVQTLDQRLTLIATELEQLKTSLKSEHE
jgi:hypothetical protein